MKSTSPPGNTAQSVQKFKLTINAKHAERHAEVAKRRARLAKGQLKVAKKAYKLARKLARKAAKKARHLVEELDAWLQQNKSVSPKRRKRPVTARRTKARAKKVPRQPRPVRRQFKTKISRQPEPTPVPPPLPEMLPPV